MSSLILPQYRLRFAVTALLIIVIATLFWTGSRYPALDEKAMMAGAIQLEDSLSFEAMIPITADMGQIERIGVTTLNWINTNKKGMTFGILFAAAMLTALSYMSRRSFGGGLANSTLGLAIGAPLGVCVNCAAPIARGLYSGGMRAETTLAAMIASPTLNVVVLSIGFSVLPTYMMLTKIGLSLVLILVLIPLLCRLLPSEQSDPAPQVSAPAPTAWSAEELGQSTSEPLWSALFEVAKTFLQNLWYIIKLTIPLMLLAGLLGAVVATLLPAGQIAGLSFGLILLLIVSAVGLFLPVPIAFDVIMCGTLLLLGLAPGYVMALLFVLGSFSIYSFLIVTQAISLRAANLMAVAVLVLGVIAGQGVQSYHQWQSQRALDILLGQTSPPVSFMAAQASELSPPKIEVTSTPFSAPSPAADTPFTALEASDIGITKPVEFSFRDMWPPFWEGRSLASGDIDRDGDIDLVIASTEVGLYLYENDGSGQFALRPTPGPLSELPVFNAALVDIDNDGWRDLFVATYQQGNFLVRNHDGVLQTEAPIPVPNRLNAVLSMALSFADVDHDGDLDAALGNWAAGWYRRVPGEEARNRLLFNDGSNLGKDFTDLPAIPGETLSILFSDIDADGSADLLVGNDFEIPDAIYMGDGAGGFEQITFQDGLIPHTTTTTMAIKSDDLTGNGLPDLYLAQIAGRSSGVSETLKMQPLELYCQDIQDPDAKAICTKNMEIKTWYKSGNQFDPTYAARCQDLMARDQAECKAMLVKDLAIQRRDPSVCRLIPADQSIARSFCDLHFRPIRAVTAAEAEASIPQILRANVLLEKGDVAYQDTAETRGLHVGGWSWDTKIGDVDLDGDLDVYIVNGTWVPNEVSPSNLFFLNDGTGHFTEASGPFGLEDYLMTAAATAFDLEGDGDLDFVTHPVNGPLKVFRNNLQQGRGIAIELEDHLGNRDGIGAIITLTDSLGRQQRRELQLGGGFMSFDAPRVHFGLGDAVAEQLIITWPTGSDTVLSGPFDADHLYQVTRR